MVLPSPRGPAEGPDRSDAESRLRRRFKCPARPWLSPGHSRWGWALDPSALAFLPVHPSPSGAASSMRTAQGVWAVSSPWEVPLGLIRCVPCHSDLGAPEPGLWQPKAEGRGPLRASLSQGVSRRLCILPSPSKPWSPPSFPSKPQQTMDAPAGEHLWGRDCPQGQVSVTCLGGAEGV